MTDEKKPLKQKPLTPPTDEQSTSELSDHDLNQVNGGTAPAPGTSAKIGGWNRVKNT